MGGNNDLTFFKILGTSQGEKKNVVRIWTKPWMSLLSIFRNFMENNNFFSHKKIIFFSQIYFFSRKNPCPVQNEKFENPIVFSQKKNHFFHNFFFFFFTQKKQKKLFFFCEKKYFFGKKKSTIFAFFILHWIL